MGICWLLLYQKLNMEWFLLQRFVDLPRIYFLLIISRNHSNRVRYHSKSYLFWYQDFDRFMQVVVHYLMSILMICKYTGGKILQIKDTFFTLNLWMTATEICRISLLRTFFLFFGINLFCSITNVLCWNFLKFLILLCRKIFSVFYPILHKTFSNSSGFALI